MVATYEAHSQIEAIMAEQANKKSEPVGNANRPRTAAAAASQYMES